MKIKNFKDFNNHIDEGVFDTIKDKIGSLAKGAANWAKKTLKDLLLEEDDELKEVKTESLKIKEAFNMTLVNSAKAEDQWEFTKIGSLTDTATDKQESYFLLRSTSDNLLKIVNSKEASNGVESIICSISNNTYKADDKIILNITNDGKYEFTIKKIYNGLMKTKK
jgi:hypothetical protein